MRKDSKYFYNFLLYFLFIIFLSLLFCNQAEKIEFSRQKPSGMDEYIRITDPNGGEELTAGLSYDIKWTHSGKSKNVKIQLLKGASLDYTIVKDTPAGPESGGVVGTDKPGIRMQPAMGSMGNGRALLFGGWYTNSPDPTLIFLDETWLYSNSGWEKLTVSTAPGARSAIGASGGDEQFLFLEDVSEVAEIVRLTLTKPGNFTYPKIKLEDRYCQKI
jgi:hypothetical protein